MHLTNSSVCYPQICQHQGSPKRGINQRCQVQCKYLSGEKKKHKINRGQHNECHKCSTGKRKWKNGNVQWIPSIFQMRGDRLAMFNLTLGCLINCVNHFPSVLRPCLCLLIKFRLVLHCSLCVLVK